MSDTGKDVLSLGLFRIFSALSSWSVRHFLLLPLGQFVIFCSVVLVFSFLELSGAKMGAAQRHGPDPRAWWTRVRVQLKIALVFDPVFYRFWSDSTPQDGSKIDQKAVPKLMFFWIGIWK